MFKIKTSTKLAIIIMMIVNACLWTGISLRMMPDPQTTLLESRIRITELIGLNAGVFAQTNRIADFEKVVQSFLEKNQGIESVGVRSRGSDYRFCVGGHKEKWQNDSQASDQTAMDIFANGRQWGTVEILFRAEDPKLGLAHYLSFPNAFVLFVSSLTGLAAWLTFAQTFKYLDPSKVVPGRVRSALDSLSEGLVLLDPNWNIVHCNEAFSSMVAIPADDLFGTPISRFQWISCTGDIATTLPWVTSAYEQKKIIGELMQLEFGGEIQKYHVNSNPIGDGKGKCRGVLISFDNVTLLEKRKQDLAEMIDSLRLSRDEIQSQNEQLRFLASRDPLTTCYNRRSFWEFFEHYWANTQKDLLSLIMVDIDHFKSINDNYGHSKGDDVLRETGALLQHVVGNNGNVCRFGGEELVILLPKLGLDDALAVAEGLHQAFNRCQLAGLSITASIGVSNRKFGAMDSQHLLDQADQCLYVAKRNGRNQIVRFDTIDSASVIEVAENIETVNQDTSALKLSYTTAMALFSALAYHDQSVARHSIQLADVSLMLGRRRLDPSMLYLLEIAALLHEIGRLGSRVPMESEIDLCDMEWRESYLALQKLSCEVCRSALSSRILKQIVFEPNPEEMKQLGLSTKVIADFEECFRILNVVDHFLHHLQCSLAPAGQKFAEALTLTQLTCHPTASEWCGMLMEMQKDVQDLLVDKNLEDIVYDPETAGLLVASIEDLCLALTQKDISKLRHVVSRLKAESTGKNVTLVTDAVGELHKAMEQRGAEFDDLLEHIDHIFNLCRMTRTKVLETAEERSPRSKLIKKLTRL